jgi:hypothetical protein
MLAFGFGLYKQLANGGEMLAALVIVEIDY